MTIGKIIQRIQSLYNMRTKSDDNRLAPQRIYNIMISVRSRLLSLKAKKHQKISQWNYQTIPCMELEIVPVHDCSCVPPVGCSILKTKHLLPSPLVDLNRHLIQSVTSIDGEIVYPEISWIEKKYKPANKYTANKADSFIRRGYLYITYKNGPKLITVTGLFNDPIEAYNYSSFCSDMDTPCISALDRDFPMDYDLIDVLVDMCASELINSFANQPRENKQTEKAKKE